MNTDSLKDYTQEQLTERATAINDKMKKLMEDEAFAEKLVNTEEPEDVQKLFAEHGVELTIDEVKALGRLLERAADSDGELSEEDLEDVAGGLTPLLFVGLAAVAAGSAAATLIANNARKIGNWFRRW